MSHHPKHSYEFGTYRIDVAERQLWCGLQLIPLQPKEFDLMLVLVQHTGHLLTKDDLFHAVWPGTFIEESTLVNHISHLRKILNQGSVEQFIQTVPKHGYRFIAEVKKVAVAEPQDSQQKEPLEIKSELAITNDAPSPTISGYKLRVSGALVVLAMIGALITSAVWLWPQINGLFTSWSSPKSESQPRVTFILKWGSTGTGDGEFNHPFSAAINSEGHVYIADSLNHRIQMFTADGTFFSKWGKFGTLDGEFNGPLGIAVDKSGNVYVADTDNHRIQKFTSDGRLLAKWGGKGETEGKFNGPRNLALDSFDNVYVADTFNQRIQKFDSDGNFLMDWGKKGEDIGYFNNPMDVAVSANDQIYVADRYNRRIQRFTTKGVFLSQWGGIGQFSNPRALAVTPSNLTFVVDREYHLIQMFDSIGIYITQWGGGGVEDGKFKFPCGLATDMSDHVYIVDTNNDRIQKFRVEY